VALHIRRSTVTLGLALLALGCGGSGALGGDGGAGAGGSGGSTGTGGSGDPMCTADFTPCGGNLVGRWRSDPVCKPMQPTMAVNGCQGEMFDLDGVTSTTTWMFNADLSFTITISAEGTATVHAPQACLVDQNGLQLDCNTDGSGAGAMYASRIKIIGGKPGTVTCEAANAACSCTIPFVPAPVSVQGTYSTSGTTATLNLGLGAVTADYCVSGDTLKMRAHDMTTVPGVGDFVRQ
jgi:hypothetical protein